MVVAMVPLAAALDSGEDLLGQALAVLQAAAPDDDPGALPAGQADRMLLSVHEAVLGSALELTIKCPECAELTTLPLGRADVGEHAPRSAWRAPGVGAREPSYCDLLAARGDADALLAACAIGTGATLEDLAAIEGSLCGPLNCVCPECGAPVSVDVDLVALVLAALSQIRVELDREVHLLAAGYGWDLATIEALPDDRRRRLAAMIAGSQP